MSCLHSRAILGLQTRDSIMKWREDEKKNPLQKTDSRRDRLELGAGGGLVGLAVALGCHTDGPLYLTDQAVMLSLMEHNIALNNLQGKARSAILNW
jgi:hypothetical protein